MYKVVVCDTISDAGIEILKKEKDIELQIKSDVNKKELPKQLTDADAIITRSSTTIDKEFLSFCENLKVIGRAGVGVDNIDLDEASKRGIVVLNMPTGNTLAATEHTMTHMLNCLRFMPNANYELKYKHKWDRKKWMGIELYGKTVGIIGMGRIGSRVAIRVMSFGANVVVYDPYIPKEKATKIGAKIVDNLDELLKVSDIITIHTPKTEETYNMIDKEEIEKMKDGVILINCARGGLYNEKALYEGLKSGKIRALGIDVFENEPQLNHPLFEFDNVFATPHLGANTYESQIRVGEGIARSVVDALKGRGYENAVNIKMEEEEITELGKQFLGLAERMGSFLSQYIKSFIKRVTIYAHGEIESCTNSLGLFSSVGILKNMIDEHVNYVNAPYLAKERGLEIETKIYDKATEFKNYLLLEAEYDDNKKIEIGGTVFEPNKARIVYMDGFDMEIELTGNIIVFRNYDKPGIIGKVGEILGKHNINIADFRLGRKQALGEALSFIKVDQEVNDAILKEILSIDGAISIAKVKI
ncbi:phosphoglycerate dehydrogenase [Hippea maritima]|uniref:D-3-phosphoglycerate dehydrogenase n=1 Tax=Hippea maritima (strain ATCC 700847 / DSM 10411 / MH2) TaxID=760142 RepID=F2LUJ6_HIPMA|nr:phosphoglycerate dehydrogenase [Hippea maritima]AEA34586.1 D-3-phosphoglycerate dehydrogenase [Hippea maritima DSM 10411]